MPLLHFLCGQSSPWEQAKNDIRHNTEIPKWWGIASTVGCHSYEIKLHFVKCKHVHM